MFNAQLRITCNSYKHYNNQAERAIQIFKAHFKLYLVIVDPNFLLAEWDRLILQTNITLNLLCSTWYNLKLLAYSYVFSTFNFISTLLAPPRTKVVAYTYSDKYNSYDLNSKVGWYVELAMNHY